MKKYYNVEFASYDFENEKAYEIYSDSSLEFWKDSKGTFYYSDNPCSEKIELGSSMKDVESLLLEFAE